MKKLLLTTAVLAVVALAATDAQAGIFRRWRRVAPVTVRPAPAVVATADPGYRAFSYEPAGAVYQPARAYRGNTGIYQRGFQDAGAKIRGQFN